MNDRIRELEAQCWVQIPCDFDMAEDGLSTIRTVFDREKFALLIIKECVDVHVDNYGIDIISDALNEHFGIEE